MDNRKLTLSELVREKLGLDEEHDEKDYKIDFFKDFPEFRQKARVHDEENNMDYFSLPQLI